MGRLFLYFFLATAQRRNARTLASWRGTKPFAHNIKSPITLQAMNGAIAVIAA